MVGSLRVFFNPRVITLSSFSQSDFVFFMVFLWFFGLVMEFRMDTNNNINYS